MFYACILIGLLFLVNPNIAVIDLLPDAVGYLLIFCGILRASKLHRTLRDAFITFRKLFILSLIKIPAMFLYLSFANSSTDVWGLLFSLGFGFGEIWFGIAAFRDFFDGLVGLSLGVENQTPQSSPLYRGLYEVKLITVLFIVGKPILTVLPELSSLTNGDYGTVTSTGIVGSSSYHTVFLLISAVAVLLFGIFWYQLIFRYLRRIARDTDFNRTLAERYEREIVGNRTVYVVYRILTALALLAASAIACLSVKLDGINYLPPVLAITMMLLAILMLKPLYPELCRPAIAGGIAAGLASAISSVYTAVFIYSFYGELMTDSEEGASFTASEVLNLQMQSDFGIIYGNIAMIVLAAIESALFILLLFALHKLLRRVITDYTGGTFAADGHLIGGSTLEQNTRGSRRLLVALTIGGIAVALTDFIQTALFAYLPVLWLVSLAVRIVYLALMTAFCARIRYELKDRYSFD